MLRSQNRFQRKPFEGSRALFENADYLDEIKSMCWCGRKASHNARVKDGKVIRHGKIVEIGGNERYLSLCRKHYSKGILGP